MATLLGTIVRILFRTTQSRGSPYSGGATIDVDYQANPPSSTSSGGHDVVWQETYTIGTSATQALDFTALADGPNGETVNMVKVDGMIIQGVAANTAALHIKANASNGLLAFTNDASDIIKYPAGSVPMVLPSGGYATSGSLKALDLVNPSGSATWTGTVTVFGRSA